MIDEARLEDVGTGRAPASPGWFVVNAAETAWIRNDAFGARANFEAGPRALSQRPDLEPQRFAETGYTLAVLEPGKPSGLYHTETAQEDFLVLSGTCLLVVEGEERRLASGDYFHSPPLTGHVLVGAGDGPCTIVMVGGRTKDWCDGEGFPVDAAAARYDASVPAPTGSPAEAYVDIPDDEPARLPWPPPA